MFLVGIIVVIVLVAVVGWMQRGTSKPVTQLPSNPINMSNLKIEDIIIGNGDEAATGDKILVNYRGTLVDGKEFDSSYKRNQPFEFTLGAGQVIAGWDQGFTGMKVGGKRKLTIPPELAYGSRGAGADIPPNSTLVFEVELLKVSK